MCDEPLEFFFSKRVANECKVMLHSRTQNALLFFENWKKKSKNNAAKSLKFHSIWKNPVGLIHLIFGYPVTFIHFSTHIY